MTTRQFTSFIAAATVWSVAIYYWLLDRSIWAIDKIPLSPAWYGVMLFLGSIAFWIFIADARQRR